MAHGEQRAEIMLLDQILCRQCKIRTFDDDPLRSPNARRDIFAEHRGTLEPAWKVWGLAAPCAPLGIPARDVVVDHMPPSAARPVGGGIPPIDASDPAKWTEGFEQLSGARVCAQQVAEQGRSAPMRTAYDDTVRRDETTRSSGSRNESIELG